VAHLSHNIISSRKEGNVLPLTTGGGSWKTVKDAEMTHEEIRQIRIKAVTKKIGLSQLGQPTKPKK
jgi:hypothetical protein